MKKNNLGIYVHVPFCVQKCAYCDFYSLSDSSYIDAYTEALINNVSAVGEIAKDRVVDTIFFGGGTPSLLGPKRFRRIYSALSQNLCLADDLEFTVEVNPATVSVELADAFADCSVNRVSIGLQSSDAEELFALSRIHGFDDFVNTFNIIKERVTDNISVDIMYGIPKQNIDSLTKTVEDVLSLSPAHISAYGLKIEPQTPFGRTGSSLILPDEDEQEQMYAALCQKLSEASFNRYEISNFAKRGMECRHNLKYWNRDEYIGIGPAAYSFFDGYRFSISRDLKKYITHFTTDQAVNIIDEKRLITDTDVNNEEIMLGLRLENGIIPSSALLERAQIYVDNSFMKYDGQRLSFTTKGFLVSNYILSDLIE